MHDGLTFVEAASYIYASQSFSTEVLTFTRALPGSGAVESRAFTAEEHDEMDNNFGALRICALDSVPLGAQDEAAVFSI